MLDAEAGRYYVCKSCNKTIFLTWDKVEVIEKNLEMKFEPFYVEGMRQMKLVLDEAIRMSIRDMIKRQEEMARLYKVMATIRPGQEVEVIEKL